jgi:Na+/proline symporter
LPINNTGLIFLAGAACLAALLFVVVLPLLTRFGPVLEALPLLIEGLGEYFGNPRLVWLGCLIIGLTLIGCCILTVVGGGLLLGCFTGNPSQLCRLIGR